MKKLNKINQIREKNKNKEIENCTFKPLTNENVDEFVNDENGNIKELEIKIEQDNDEKISPEKSKRSRSKKMQIILKQRDSNKPFATAV